MLASEILGRTAVKRKLKVTIGETFGLSQRGGAVMSHIRISENRNYGPLIPRNMAHIILGLEPLETVRILTEYGNEETVCIVNSRPIHPLNVIAGDAEYPDPEWIRQVLAESSGRFFWLEATRLAMDLGGPIMLNMIMLGALCTLPDFPLDIKDIEMTLEDIFSESKIEPNRKALETGRRLIQKNED